LGYDQQLDLLFTALAEQLKMPLLQIARLSEMAHEATLPRIGIISEQALRLVDAYIKSHDQTELILEPLTTSAVLYDVAEIIAPFAKACDYQIEIDLHGTSRPIMAHRETLKTMLMLLSSSLIEAGIEEEESPRHLILGTHRSSTGTVVGAFSSHLDVSQRALNMTRQLHGRATQAVPALGSAGGAGLAIADRLSERLQAPLKAYRHRSLSGIGSLFMPSQQLSLIT
jgi:hypothetical protein